MTRPWLLPAVPLYAAAARARDLAYRKEILTTRRLPAPVISVGAIAAGGSGKTPMTHRIADMLSASGRTPVVLSRGYGRTSNEVLEVLPDGDADRFGDEPLMLARRGLRAWVGADRYAAGMAAAQAIPQAGVAFVLDDGFQHRGLHRTANLVMLAERDLHDALLPAGNLREPLSQLVRADILAFEYAEAASVSKFLDCFPRVSCARPAIWLYTRELHWPHAYGVAVVFCGIARPERFLAAAEARPGISVAKTKVFPDHHRYSDAEITALCGAAREARADLFLTTEKDLARLTAAQRAKLEEVGRIVAPSLQLVLDEPDFCQEQLEALLQHGEEYVV